jgi:phosphotransferase system enzyme I (PtsI)
MKTDRVSSAIVAEGGERILRGLGVSPGIVAGTAHVIESGFEQVPEYVVLPAELDAERERFGEAVGRSQRQLRKLKAKTAALPESAAEEINYLLDAHLAILSGSRLIRGVYRRINEDHYNAEFAVQAELSSIAQQFAAMDDAYLASRIQDVREVGARLIRNLHDKKYQAFSTLTEGSIIIAEEITPADTALMDPRRVAGFAATLGGAEGHTAIMARSLGLPAVLGVAGLMPGIRPGQRIIVDGTTGRVIINPSEQSLADYHHRRAALEADRAQLKTLINLPARTRDVVDIGLYVNMELPREVAAANSVGAHGVGLLRTEFMFMNREDLPSEDEQYEILKEIVVGMEGKPVTLRTIDIGGEKLASSFSDVIAETANPALGLRAIRLSLREPRLLDDQLAAMLRAGAHGPTRILLPMVTSVSEVRQVRTAMTRVARRLRRRRVEFANPLPPLGVMIEVPGAALTADALAQAADFFSIGTNDLVMYTLAIDRGDEQVAPLFDPLHPAVVRLIQFTTEAALRARIPISICGEIAGDPRYTALLIGLGIRELSMAPINLLPVKRRLRTLDTMAAAHRARIIVDQSDAGRIAALLDDFNDVG